MKIKTPVIIINLKTYEQGSGKNAQKVMKQLASVAKKEKVEVPEDVYTADEGVDYFNDAVNRGPEYNYWEEGDKPETKRIPTIKE